MISSNASRSLRPQACQQLQYLRLDGDVERRGGFVGDQQCGIVGQRHGDHHPLPLSTGKLMGKRLQPMLGIGEASLMQHLDHPRAKPIGW